MEQQIPYIPNNKSKNCYRCSAFDGHDAAINIMRSIQFTGVEVISPWPRPKCRSSEYSNPRRCNAIIITSYQEDMNILSTYYRSFMVEVAYCLRNLQRIAWNYAPDDGRAMGLQGMINDLQQSDFPTE
jgi:methylmalonyl-CoA mutase